MCFVISVPHWDLEATLGLSLTHGSGDSWVHTTAVTRMGIKVTDTHWNPNRRLPRSVSLSAREKPKKIKTNTTSSTSAMRSSTTFHFYLLVIHMYESLWLKYTHHKDY